MNVNPLVIALLALSITGNLAFIWIFNDIRKKADEKLIYLSYKLWEAEKHILAAHPFLKILLRSNTIKADLNNLIKIVENSNRYFSKVGQ